VLALCREYGVIREAARGGGSRARELIGRGGFRRCAANGHSNFQYDLGIPKTFSAMKQRMSSRETGASRGIMLSRK
jgi:hypothetical protein